MKNNVIRINNKISVKSTSNISNNTPTNHNSNRNESEESLVNKFSTSEKSQQGECLITNSCNNIETLSNSSSIMLNVDKSKNELSFSAIEFNKNKSKSHDIEDDVKDIEKMEENEDMADLQAIQNSDNSQCVRRSRNESILKRFRSFSIDVMRSMELAHEMVDLRNSNFVSATQSAAQQQYNTANTTTASIDRADADPEYGADVSDDDGHNYLSPYYRVRADTKNNENHLSEISSSGLIKNPNGNLPSTSTSFNNRTEIENKSLQKNIERSHTSNSNAYLSATSLKSNYSLDQKPWTKFRNTNNSTKKDVKIVHDESNDTNIENINEDVNENNYNNKKNQENLNDEVDFQVKRSNKKNIPDDIHISILEVFIYLWGVITFFADFITDIILSIEYYNNQKAWLGSMTLIFVIVPNVTLSLFSLSWYIDKYYSTKKDTEANTEKLKKTPNSITCDSITFWITTIFFVVFQLDLVWKYIQGFVYTLKGWACRSVYKNLQWEKYYIEKQIKCDTDIGMLRLIDVFMDSGPQVLLQLYVITTQNLEESGSANLAVFTFKDFQTTSLEVKQFVSILSSLFSMGYALAGYHRCLRNQQFIFCLEQNKPLPRPMSWLSTIMQFLWYLFLISPRVLSMALFASTFRSWFLMIIFTHWLFMYFWILRLKTNYCITSQEVYSAREEIFEKFYNFVCSFIYIFVYFNLKSGPTRLRYLIYYIIFYSENLIFCISYFFFSKEINYLYKMSMLFIVVFGFWIAITFQIVYYLHCHPSHDIRVCVTKQKEFHFIHKKTLRPPTSYVSTSDDDSIEENLTERIRKFHKNQFHPNDTNSLNLPTTSNGNKFAFTNKSNGLPRSISQQTIE